MSPAAFPAFRAALFDLDGTLVRTFIDFAGLRGDLLELARENGLPPVFSERDDILEIADGIRSVGGATLYNEALRRIVRREEAGCENPEIVEGASHLLTTLRKKGRVPVAVVTRNCRTVSDRLLTRMDLPCDLLVAREDTLEYKPHPEPLLYACRALGVAPSECIMTGDLWADIAAGRAAGVAATIGVRWSYLPADRFARCAPDFEVSSLREASRLILGAAKSVSSE